MANISKSPTVAEFRKLTRLEGESRQLLRQVAAKPRAETAEAYLTARRARDAACEALRLSYFPTAVEVFVAFGEVHVRWGEMEFECAFQEPATDEGDEYHDDAYYFEDEGEYTRNALEADAPSSGIAIDEHAVAVVESMDNRQAAEDLNDHDSDPSVWDED